MDFTTGAIVCVAGMLFLMMMGLPVIYSLGFIAIFVAYFTYGPMSLDKIGWTTFNTLYNLNWVPLPLFVFLASLIAETPIGEQIYRAARAWLSRINGGLIVTSILGEAAISAAVGTSAAAILAVGKIAKPEFERYGYDEGLSMGGLCCGGSLGPLIPPSAGMIIYGVLSETSIGRLFMAGILPGILLAAMLATVAILLCTRNPKLGPAIGGVTWKERFFSLRLVWPIVVIMFCILGSIYLGVASPTEAAGVGVVAVLLIGVAFFKLRWQGLKRALMETAKINGMILFMMIGAWIFSYVIGASNVVKLVTGLVTDSNMSPWIVIISINVLLIILGCFLDGITIMLLTIPIFVPVIVEIGFNPIWFGVLYVVNMQIGLITPPMGLELFLMRTAFDVPMDKLLKGVSPFLATLFIFLALIIAVPSISLWLPGMMIK
ncbi:MAG: TRAP transporter large permease [Dehalococcoidales bacterium]|nr:TRAP transporter large permease [Dehalococcoidales bacterium]